jgi:hypothetical protein
MLPFRLTPFSMENELRASDYPCMARSSGKSGFFIEEMLKALFPLGRLSDLTSTDVEGKADFQLLD